jgi:hypothetical protein
MDSRQVPDLHAEGKVAAVGGVAIDISDPRRLNWPWIAKRVSQLHGTRTFDMYVKDLDGCHVLVTAALSNPGAAERETR